MGIFPCAVGSHRYAGRQHSIYLGLANNAGALSAKRRLCSYHFDLEQLDLQQRLTLVAVGDMTQVEDGDLNANCSWCGQPGEGGGAYAAVYKPGEEPKQYFASLCVAHAREWTEQGHLGLR